MDNPQLFDQIANAFVTQAAMKFVILLWGEKSELKNREVLEKFPVFSYDEIIEMGRKSRKLLVDSHEASKAGKLSVILYLSFELGPIPWNMLGVF